MLVRPYESLVATVGFVDPAGGKNRSQILKKVGARSAIVVVGMDALARVFVLHAWAKRCSTTALLTEIFRVADEFAPRPFAIEANAMQSLFVDCAAYIAGTFGKRSLNITPYYQPTGIEKEFRNRTAIQPVLSQGRLLMTAEQRELRAELLVHPRAAVKDLVDALGSCCALLPRIAGARGSRNAEADGLAAYLRELGTNPADIEQRVADLLAQTR